METINLPSLRSRMASLEADILLTAQHLAVAEIYARLADLKNAPAEMQDGTAAEAGTRADGPQTVDNRTGRGHRHPNSIAALSRANAARSTKRPVSTGAAAQAPNA
jgi:Flp pilus assembly CpaE family ATPase